MNCASYSPASLDLKWDSGTHFPTVITRRSDVICHPPEARSAVPRPTWLPRILAAGLSVCLSFEEETATSALQWIGDGLQLYGPVGGFQPGIFVLIDLISAVLSRRSSDFPGWRSSIEISHLFHSVLDVRRRYPLHILLCFHSQVHDWGHGRIHVYCGGENAY